jgi:hypothetical protein
MGKFHPPPCRPRDCAKRVRTHLLMLPMVISRRSPPTSVK